MYIGEAHNEAIDEYIDSVLSGEGLVHPFINEELARQIKTATKKAFLTGYKDCEETTELEDERIYVVSDRSSCKN
jgi:hypothetical protein